MGEDVPQTSLAVPELRSRSLESGRNAAGDSGSAVGVELPTSTLRGHTQSHALFVWNSTHWGYSIPSRKALWDKFTFGHLTVFHLKSAGRKCAPFWPP